jgi:hypothetical protein
MISVSKGQDSPRPPIPWCPTVASLALEVVIDVKDARRFTRQCQHRRRESALQGDHLELVGDR